MRQASNFAVMGRACFLLNDDARPAHKLDGRDAFGGHHPPAHRGSALPPELKHFLEEAVPVMIK